MRLHEWAALFALSLLALALLAPLTGEELALQEYCEMRQIYKETSGEFGWPNHNPTLEELCP